MCIFAAVRVIFDREIPFHVQCDDFPSFDCQQIRSHHKWPSCTCSKGSRSSHSRACKCCMYHALLNLISDITFGTTAVGDRGLQRDYRLWGACFPGGARAHLGAGHEPVGHRMPMGDRRSYTSTSCPHGFILTKKLLVALNELQVALKPRFI